MERITADTDQQQYSDEQNGHTPDGYPSDIFSTLAANVANFNAAPDSRKAIHAKAIKACLDAAQKVLSVLASEFGEQNTSDALRFNGNDMAALAGDGALRIKKETDPIETARQMVASGKRGRLETELGLYEQADWIIKTDEAAGLTNGRNIHYQRASSLAWIKRAVREAEVA